MASLLARLWARLCPKRVPWSIMIVGLDNSGKTSILNRLASSSACHVPTTTTATTTPTSTSISASPSSSRPQSPTCSSDTNNLNASTNQMTISAGSTTKQANNNVDANSDANNNGNRNIMPTVGYNYERIQYRNLALTVLDFSGQNKYRSLWQEFYNGVDAIVFVIDSSDLIRLVVARDELENMLSHPYFSTLAGDGHNQDRQQQQFVGNDSLTIQHHNSLPSTSARDLHQTQQSSALLAQNQITISQGKLIQMPLDTAPLTVRSATKISGGDNPLSSKVQSSSLARKRTKVPILFLANKADLANSVNTEAIIKALNLNQLAADRHPWYIRATSVNSSQGIVEAFDWLVNQLLTSAV